MRHAGSDKFTSTHARRNEAHSYTIASILALLRRTASCAEPLSLAGIAILALFSFAASPAGAADFAFITTTDYITGNSAVVGAEPPYPVDCNIRPLHSDAVARFFDDLVYVVNRKGADNVQILDPKSGFSTVRQFSVGTGSDPHDILVLSPTKAYVTRYNTNVIWIVNPSAGVQTGSIDLSSLADSDGLAEIDMMCRVGNRAFVTVQRLDRNNYWGPAGASYVAVIDTQTNLLVDTDPATPGTQSIQLTVPNPYSDIQLNPYTGKLYVSCVGFWGLPDGGVVAVNPATLQSEAIVLAESAAGGDMADVEIDLGDRGFAIVSDADFYTVLISFNAGTGVKTGTLYDPNAYVLQDIEISPRKELWVADRSPTLPGIRIWDVASRTPITASPLSVCLPPFDITFSLPVQTGIGGPPLARAAVTLGEAYPNPFTPSTTIPFALEHASRVSLTIYDASGRRVCALVDGDRAEGPHAVVWSGRDGASRPLPSGVYFARLDADGVVVSRKIVLVR